MPALQGKMCDDLLPLSSVIDSLTRPAPSCFPPLTVAYHDFFGLPLGRLLGTSMSRTIAKALPSSLLCTCPYHLNLLALITLLIWVRQHLSAISSLVVLFLSNTPATAGFGHSWIRSQLTIHLCSLFDWLTPNEFLSIKEFLLNW